MSVQSVISEWVKSNSKRDLCNIVRANRAKLRWVALVLGVLYIFLR